MTRWAMVVDLSKCVGCETCKRVCEEVNNVPPGADWRRVVHRNVEGNPEGEAVFLSMSCMHCGEPPCLEVCPTSATNRRSDGIVEINDETCVGCGSCIVACPYMARSIKFQDKLSLKEKAKLRDAAPANPDRIGVCTKCDFCSSQVDEAIKRGLNPGQDPEATPACVRYCISEALQFGDLDDPESTVSRLIQENKTVRLNDELGTDPSVYYIVG